MKFTKFYFHAAIHNYPMHVSPLFSIILIAFIAYNIPNTPRSTPTTPFSAYDSIYE